MSPPEAFQKQVRAPTGKHLGMLNNETLFLWTYGTALLRKVDRIFIFGTEKTCCKQLLENSVLSLDSGRVLGGTDSPLWPPHLWVKSKLCGNPVMGNRHPILPCSALTKGSNRDTVHVIRKRVIKGSEDG